MATIKNVKVAEKLVEKLFYQRCTGIQIPAMKLGTLNKIGAGRPRRQDGKGDRRSPL